MNSSSIGRIVPFDETRSVDRSIGLNDEPIQSARRARKKLSNAGRRRYAASDYAQGFWADGELYAQWG